MGKSLMMKVWFVKDKKTGVGEYVSALREQEAIEIGCNRRNIKASDIASFENKNLKRRILTRSL